MLVKDWIAVVSEFSTKVRKQFEFIYGDDPSIIEDRKKAYLTLLNKFSEKYGVEREIVICRSPWRVNLKGVHIEHRGGFVNYLTHRREILIAASPRNDDKICLTNLRNELFPPREFSIREELKKGNWKDWWEYIAAPEVANSVIQSQGDWMNYV